MQIINNFKNFPEYAKGSVVAIGNFDGMHKGHVAVIQKAREIAATTGINDAVISFSPHPLKLLKPEIKPFNLTDETQKNALIQDLGVKYLFAINFDIEFSQITAAAFIKDFLVDKLNVKHVVTGEDFIFGYNRAGNSITLEHGAAQYNFGYTRLSPVRDANSIFSSSMIRRNLAEGRLDKVKEILGRNFVINGIVVTGNKQGRNLGFPTINIELGDYIRPAFGVYAAKIYIAGRSLYGAANIGIRPTINGTKELLEVHIFDFSENIYGQSVQVELIEYIRPEQKFVKLESLQAQIAEDCIQIRKIFS